MQNSRARERGSQCTVRCTWRETHCTGYGHVHRSSTLYLTRGKGMYRFAGAFISNPMKYTWIVWGVHTCHAFHRIALMPLSEIARNWPKKIVKGIHRQTFTWNFLIAQYNVDMFNAKYRECLRWFRRKKMCLVHRTRERNFSYISNP